VICAGGRHFESPGPCMSFIGGRRAVLFGVAQVLPSGWITIVPALPFSERENLP